MDWNLAASQVSEEAKKILREKIEKNEPNKPWVVFYTNDGSFEPISFNLDLRPSVGDIFSFQTTGRFEEKCEQQLGQFVVRAVSTKVSIHNNPILDMAYGPSICVNVLIQRMD